METVPLADFLALKQEFEQKEKDVAQRLWIDANVTQFDTLLRLNYAKSTEEFAKIVLDYIAEKTNAFLGVFYVCDTESQESKAIATYACKLEKLHKSSYEMGEGIVGQAVESQKTIYFNDLPQQSLDFNLSSVKVNMASILVVPLIFNAKVYGVLEFMHLVALEEKFHLLLDIISKNTASMLESIFNNALTQQLLINSQQKNEELLAQEEELRQNMEELQSTQEELHRKQAEVQAQFNAIDQSSILRSEFTPDGYFKNANDIFYKVFGYNQDEIVGKHHSLFLPTELRDTEEYHQFWENLRAGKQQPGIYERIGKNGKTITLDATYSPLVDKNGNVLSILKYAIDITEMKNILTDSQQKNEELLAQEEELRQNMEELTTTQDTVQNQLEQITILKADAEARINVFNLTTILSEADLYGNITFVNDKLLEVSQYTSEELIGKPHNILRHPDMPKAVFQYFWNTIKSGKVFKGIIKNRKKDGSHYWVESVVAPVFDEEGKITKYIGARYFIEDDNVGEKAFVNMCKDLNIELV